jgi:hypothetical protein
MEVTEHNVDADWNDAEIEALMALVKGQLSQEGNSQYVNLFYAKIYGKLVGMKHYVGRTEEP